MSGVAIETFSVVLAEDDEGHATLVRRNLKRAGLASEPIHLHDGQEALDYLYRRAPWTDRPLHDALVLLLDLNMPRLGGIDVLTRIKKDHELAKIPVFVLTTTDDRRELDRCYTIRTPSRLHAGARRPRREGSHRASRAYVDARQGGAGLALAPGRQHTPTPPECPSPSARDSS